MCCLDGTKLGNSSSPTTLPWASDTKVGNYAGARPKNAPGDGSTDREEISHAGAGRVARAYSERRSHRNASGMVISALQ